MKTLAEITKELTKITKEIREKSFKLSKLEYTYWKRYYSLLVNSPASNMSKQEAEAKSIIMDEPIYEEYQDLKLDLKLLYMEREVLIECVKNIRVTEANL